MKNKIAIIITVMSAWAVTAQDKIKEMPLTITATAEIQSQIFDDGTTTKIAAPQKFSVTTKTLLAMLAQDEFFDGNYPSTVFPSGAKLILMADETVFSNSTFQVVDKEGLELVDVSDELEITIVVGNESVSSGVENDATGVVTGKENQSFIANFSFDNTGSSTPGTLYSFYLQGVVADVTTDTLPKNDSYTEKETAKMSSGAGPGKAVGVVNTSPLIITGSVSFSGTKVFSLQ